MDNKPLVAIHQPQYMPWLGYFDKMDRADIFVFLDDVQFKKNEWQNRNRVKTSQGWQWLTVPVIHKFPQLICETEINRKVNWRRKHLNSLKANYSRAPFFEKYLDELAPIFAAPWARLGELNIAVVRKLAQLLGIGTQLLVSSEMGEFPDDPDGRIIAVVDSLGSDRYLAGGGGHNYMDMKQYERAGVDVSFQEYRHPVFRQLFGEFIPNLSVLDLLFNEGPKSLSIIKEGRVYPGEG